MRSGGHAGFVRCANCARLPFFAFVAFVLAMLASAPAVLAQNSSLAELVSGVVGVKTFIDPDARTIQNLGRERDGTGIVIDNNGLVVTIGYIMVEAYAAEITTQDGRSVPANIVAYDHETGFGLLQATSPLKVTPLALGKSADVKENDALIAAPFGGIDKLSPVLVVSKREFAGSWEYLLEQALFTSPPVAHWAGAALIDRHGKLVGVGSLMVGDATGKGEGLPGNMFVPVDLLPPILADLIASGRAGGAPKPWLGLTTEQAGDRLVVSRVAPGGPAEKAGIRKGDIIAGVARALPQNLADFYRKVRAQGAAGATVPLNVYRDGETRSIDVQSMDRMDHLKLKGTF